MADEQAEAAEQRPRIVIEFEGPDLASARLHVERVTRGQRMVAVQLVEQWDRDMHQAELSAVMQEAAAGARVARGLKLVRQ